MKYRDLLTTFFALGFFLSLAYTLAVAENILFWIVPIVFFLALVWAIYFLWIK